MKLKLQRRKKKHMIPWGGGNYTTANEWKRNCFLSVKLALVLSESYVTRFREYNLANHTGQQQQQQQKQYIFIIISQLRVNSLAPQAAALIEASQDNQSRKKKLD